MQYNKLINSYYYFWHELQTPVVLYLTLNLAICITFFESIMFLREITHRWYVCHIYPAYSLRRCVRLHPEATIAEEKPLLSLQLRETRVCPSKRNWVAADRPSADTSTNMGLGVMRSWSAVRLVSFVLIPSDLYIQLWKIMQDYRRLIYLWTVRSTSWATFLSETIPFRDCNFPSYIIFSITIKYYTFFNNLKFTLSLQEKSFLNFYIILDICLFQISNLKHFKYIYFCIEYN